MRVLVACEESQTVCKAFRALGHEAYSCDIQPCSGGHPEWHILGDVFNYINGILCPDCLGLGYSIALKQDCKSCNGEGWIKWDLMIGHPECRYIANSGVHWLHRIPGRWEKMVAGANFFKALWDSNIPLIALENPIPHKYALEIIGKKYDQIIQPHQFGNPESKATCLWLKGLPKLGYTNILIKPESGHWNNQTPSGQNKLGPSPERAKLRSKTYQGIADAMANQWGGLK